MLEMEFKRGTGALIPKACAILSQNWIKHRVMRGKKGPQAIEVENAVVVCKEYFWEGKTLSLDEKIASYCRRERLKIVFYVESTGTFVQYLPDVVFEKGWRNKRGKDETFLNIDAKYGETVEPAMITAPANLPAEQLTLA